MASCPLLIQNTAGSITIYLESSVDGSAATGLTFSDVTADIKKEGGVFTALVLTGVNFTETGLGFYEVDLAAGDTDTLGNLYLRVSGASIRTTLFSALIAEIAPVTPTTTPSSPTTTVFGFVKDTAGAAVAGASVVATVQSTPFINHSGDEGVLITDSLIVVKTDLAGFFTMELITGAVVEIFISSANYRRTITVPANSSNLFDLP